MNSMKQHEIVFTRIEGNDGLTGLAYVTFESDNPGESWDILSDAVTAWVNKTAAGKEAYIASVEDFNIGDLALEFSGKHMLDWAGVSNLEVATYGSHNHENYDRHLVQQDKLKDYEYE